MRRIAREVGVTAPSIYRHYPNRDAIIADVAETGFVTCWRRFQEPIGATDGNERILVLADRYIGWALEHPELLELMQSYEAQQNPMPPGALEATQGVLQILAREIEGCMSRGEWRPGDVRLISMTFWALARGISGMHRTGRISVPAPELPAYFRAVVLQMINGVR